jgi:hypothetical protein
MALDAEADGIHTALPLTAAEQTVLSIVSGYSRRTRLHGTTVLAKLRGRLPTVTRIVAEVNDLDALQQLWTSRLPFRELYSAKNTLSFTQNDAGFEVENLVPDSYRHRVTTLRSGRGIAFGHDALTFNATTGVLTDPFAIAHSTQLHLVHPGRSLAEAFDVVLRGVIDAAECGLELDEAFVRLHNRVLTASGAGGTKARKIAQSLVQRLATLPSKHLSSLFRSRLVKTSLKSVVGVSGDRIAQDFDALRPVLGGEFSDAAIWLALTLASELEDGAADDAGNFVESSDRHETLRSRAALAQARQLAQNPSFKQVRSS